MGACTDRLVYRTSLVTIGSPALQQHQQLCCMPDHTDGTHTTMQDLQELASCTAGRWCSKHSKSMQWANALVLACKELRRHAFSTASKMQDKGFRNNSVLTAG